MAQVASIVCPAGQNSGASSETASHPCTTLPCIVLELVLEKVQEISDRNSCSLVCRDFRDAERQTRKQLRLRCIREQMGSVPSCFGAVTHLDLSSVVPRCTTTFAYSASQLAHLGNCFPNVQTLTLFCDDCQAWLSSGRLPFEGIWPNLDVVRVLRPFQNLPNRANLLAACPAHHVQARERDARVLKSLANHAVSKGPFVFRNVRKAPSGVGLPLKELVLAYPGDSELNDLADRNVADLDTLDLELLGRPFSQDLSVLRSTNFPALKNLSISGQFCLRGQNGFVFTESNVAAMLGGLPRITSLSLRAGSDLVTLPLGQSLAGMLRTLRLNLKRDPNSAERASFNLAPVLGCRLLEHLEVGGNFIFTFSRHGDAIVAIVTACQHLKSLKVDLWNTVNRPKPEEITSFFKRIVAASSQSLTQIDIQSNLHTSTGLSGNLLATLSPFSNKITSLSCSLSVPRVPFKSHIISGWDVLSDLNVRLFLGPESRLELELPNLRTLKLRSNWIHEIEFVGDHSKLASFELRYQTNGNYIPDESRIFRCIVESQLRRMKNLTSLSVHSLPPTCPIIFWLDPEVFKAIEKLPSLKRLELSAPAHICSLNVRAVKYFEELLGSSSLSEVCLPNTMDKALEDFYRRLYGHGYGKDEGLLSLMAASAETFGMIQVSGTAEEVLAKCAYPVLMSQDSPLDPASRRSCT